MEALRNFWENVRTTYDTRGDNIRLAWEIKSRRIPSLYVLESTIGKDIASSPKVTLPEPVRTILGQEIRTFQYEFPRNKTLH